jgi:hypothetical protein
MLERIGADNVFRVTLMLGEVLQVAVARAMQLRDGTG